MSDQDKEDLHKRVRQLEDKVARLEQQLDLQNKPGKSSMKRNAVSDADTEHWINRLHFGEHWLNRLGIGLLLIGVAFLFKYSIDQGWLIPPVRSVIGLAIGLTLLVSGLRMSDYMTPFRQMLQGGGIAVFYITGFATFQLYAFVPHMVIWAFMVIVTLLALSLSLQQDEATLSIVGTLGALGTPFMLYSGSGSASMLVIYTALILGAAAIIYFRKGWISLLWSMLVGGFGVLGVGILSSVVESSDPSIGEQWMLQLGIIIWALTTWGTVLLRTIFQQKTTAGTFVHLSIFWVPLWSVPLMALHWDLSATNAGLVAFGFAAIGLAGYYGLNKKGWTHLAFSHGFMALITATVGIVLFFEGTALFVMLSAEAIVLRYIASLADNQKLSLSAHILFFLVAVWILNDFYWSLDTGVNIESLTELIFISVAGTWLPARLKRTDFKLCYRILSHLMLLFWMYEFFIRFSNGQAWISIVWGCYAIGLLMAGFAFFGQKVQLTGMATIFLVVAKLFLVDLSQLQALWRILLFISFGGVFIFLGYYLQSKWQRTNPKT